MLNRVLLTTAALFMVNAQKEVKVGDVEVTSYSELGMEEIEGEDAFEL